MTHVGDVPVTAEWAELVAAATELRRDLHRQPELRFEEQDTAARVRAILTELGISHRACAGTGTVATLAPQAGGRHLALRADLDAMPIEEATGVGWSSQRPGIMHACGHDGHTSTLLLAARWLAAHEDQLPGPVTLLFQPGEEGGHGAKAMIEDGALEGVEAVFGWHNWPAIGFGKAACPDGPVMSANGTFRVDLTGAGGHASQPEVTRDPVLAAAAITVALQQVVSRRLAPHQAAVLAVTWLDADGADTVTPETAALGGSIRVPDTAARDRVFEHISAIAASTAAAHGVRADTTVTPRYDATINHPGPAGELRAALTAELGTDAGDIDLPLPVLASEDFSYYLAEVPGAFALIGADDGEGHHEPCHSPRYDFNDRLLPVAARTLLRVAGAPLPT